MQLHWIYTDTVPAGTSATSLMLISASLPDDVQGPRPSRHRLILRFVHARLCRAQIKHIDQLRPSYYPFDSTGLCRARDPMACKFNGSTETLACLTFRNFTDVDWCNLAR